MRLSALAFAALLAGLTGLAGYTFATAKTGATPSPSAFAAEAAAAPAEAGARADRLGADIKAGLRQGWLTDGQADRLNDELRQIRKGLKAAEARGGATAAEEAKAHAELAALHRQMGDIAAAARERRRRG